MCRGQLTFDEYLDAIEDDLGIVFEPEQRRQMHVIVDPSICEVVIIRCRGGSKTFDVTIAYLYIAAIGLDALFWCAQASQMIQPKKYMSFICSRTFLKYCYEEKALLKEEVTFVNGGTFRIGNCTVDNVRSPRADYLYNDEEARTDPEALDAQTPELSVSKVGKIVHGSTPFKGSPFHKNYLRAMVENIPILSLKWNEIGFINKKLIEREKRTKPTWWFKQEYECSFEAPAGAVFNNIEFGYYNLPTNCHKIGYGVDWNPSAGHYLVSSVWNDEFSTNYVLEEKNLGTNLKYVFNQLVTILIDNPTAVLEIEDGGTNTGYCDSFYQYIRDHELHELFKRILRRNWDSAGVNKSNSITLLTNAQICCWDSRQENDVADWLGKASWDSESEQPRLKKDSEQHALDAYLHSAWIARKHKTFKMEFI